MRKACGRLGSLSALVALVHCAQPSSDRSSAVRDSLPARSPFLLQGHGGLTAGIAITKVRLTCDDGVQRVLGEDEVQLVTFTTPGDCSSCQSHLAGLELMTRHRQMPLDHYFVAYAPRSTRTVDLRAYRRLVTGRLCWDEHGALWDRHNVSHTPVTALMRHDTVLLLHDAPLLAADARRALAESVAALVGR